MSSKEQETELPQIITPGREPRQSQWTGARRAVNSPRAVVSSLLSALSYWALGKLTPQSGYHEPNLGPLSLAQ